MFNIRLEEYRNKLHLNKRQMADKLELSESYYNMIENGNRQPSKPVLEKLVAISDLPEEYWIYGINKNDNISNKDDFKSLRKALETILELNVIKNAEELFDENNNPVDNLGKLLVNALKKDINKLIGS